jgi:hypothetical protein
MNCRPEPLSLPRGIPVIAGVLLLIFMVAPAAFAQGPPFFNVKDYGAAGNGVTLDRASINKAIDACARAGGGTVYFPAGVYLSGTVWLRSNVTLWFASGAELLGTADLAQYEPAVAGGFGGQWYDALIVAKDVRDAAIIGSGVIDGNGVTNPNGEERMRGPHGVLFFECQNVKVRGVTIKDAGNYSLILRHCKEVNVDDLTAHGGYDGINMHDVLNATISNCRLFSGDDSLAGSYWENVTVSNCILNSGCNGIRVGGRNVLITNCIIYGPAESWSPTSQTFQSEAGFQILPNGSREPVNYASRGPVDNMVLSNITMVNVRTPFHVAFSSDAPYSAHNLGVGRIIVNNLTALGVGKSPIYVSAPPDLPAGSIILNHVRMTAKGGSDEQQAEGNGYSTYSILQSYGIYVRNVKRLELDDVRVGFEKPDLRPALFAESVPVLDIYRFHAERTAGGPPSIEAAGIGHLVLDGKPADITPARVTEIDLPPNGAVVDEPFEVTVAVENLGPEGLASAPLQLGNETVPRTVWLDPGEKARLAFINLRVPESGELEVRAGNLTRQLRVTPRAVGRTVGPPYHSFGDVPAVLKQLAKNIFYIRAGGDYPSMQHGDQYAAIYLNRGLPSDGTVVVKVSNPDLRTGWPGLSGIMVRNDVTKPDQPGGYAILASSPAAGSYLEWAGEDSRLLNDHTKIAGNTVWPHWLKLERRGSDFTGYSSTDSVHWTKIGVAEVPGAKDALDVGMFAFRSSARFEHFKVEK